jgi:hypothetical protein
MTYSITKYTYNKAKQIGVSVKPSTNKTKKIDVYKKIKGKGLRNGLRNENTLIKVASVGAYGMNDYPTYMKKNGLKYAKTRRRLYKIRHNKDRKTRGTPGWYADKLLW